MGLELTGLKGVYTLTYQDLQQKWGPYNFHIRVYNKNLQKSRVW